MCTDAERGCDTCWFVEQLEMTKVESTAAGYVVYSFRMKKCNRNPIHTYGISRIIINSAFVCTEC